MPATIMGNNGASQQGMPANVKYDYEYPEGLDLRPGSPQHNSILRRILDMAGESSRTMSEKHATWKIIDNSLNGFVTEKSYARYKKLIDSGQMSSKSRKFRMDNSLLSQEIEIVFPYSHTILETLLAYMMATFIKEPIFQYEGRGGEDVLGAKLLEIVVQAHTVYNKIGLNLMTWFRDNFTYGFGVVAPTWKIKYGNKRVRKQSKFLGIPLPGQYTSDVEYTVLQEGNGLINIDPYSYLPDVNVPIEAVQDGEYVGWVDDTNYLDKLALETRGDEDIFNVKYLNHFAYANTYVSRTHRRRSSEKQTTDKQRPVSDIHMYVKLIPKEWGLGEGDTPEKWYFCVSNESVITQAMPMGLDHDDFPVAVIASETDGHSTLPIARMEIISGLQTTLDWTFNVHIKNVRKAVNDVYIVDPYMINVRDVERPEAGKIIRTTKAAWGRGVEGFIKNLPVNDVTRGNVNDANLLMGYMDKASGADASSQGQLRQGGPERLTESEYKGTQQGSFTRLNRIATTIGMQGMYDVGRMFAYNTRQLMTEDFLMRVTGNMPMELIQAYGPGSQVTFNVFDLYVDTDVIPRNGSNLATYDQIWMDLFKTIAGSPELAQIFDIGRIFKQVALNAGAKDVSSFIRTTQMPMQQVQQGVQAGNLIPM